MTDAAQQAAWRCPACGLEQEPAAASCRNCRAAHPGLPGLGPRDAELEIPTSTPLRAIVQVIGILALAAGAAVAIQSSARLAGLPADQAHQGEAAQTAALIALVDALDARAAALQGGATPSDRAALHQLRAQAGLDDALIGPPRIAERAREAERTLTDLAAAERAAPSLPPSQRAHVAEQIRADLHRLRAALEAPHAL